MLLEFRRWIESGRLILINSSTLVGTMAVTSGFGFIYWWIAARLYPPVAVGSASAAISAMKVLGTLGLFGLGTLLIGELPKRNDKSGSIIITGVLVAGMIGIILGTLFSIAAPYISPDLQLLAVSVGSIALFALGVGFTTVARILDQAMIGLLRSELQFWRNLFFAATKVIALIVASVWFADGLGLTIYSTWVVGIIISLIGLAIFVTLRWGFPGIPRPRWLFLRWFSRKGFEHHVLNLALQTPGLVMPIVVTALLSAEKNASFYIAWMVASLASVGPYSLTTVLYAVGTADRVSMARYAGFTLKLSFVIGMFVSVGLLLGARLILSLFGSTYVEQAEWCLRIMALGVFPAIFKTYYVAISRVYERIRIAGLLMWIGGLLELVLAALGASIGDLVGLSVGWVAAVCIEAVLIAPTVYRTVIGLNSLE